MKKPDWLKVRLQGGGVTAKVRKTLEDLQLNTVCTEANCPNKMECYERGTATFMILGRNCTRNCTFCNVSRNMPDEVNLEEPLKVAEAVKRLGLKHAVITSVTRDDLPDQGAGQFVKVVEEIRKTSPQVTIELLIPDMQGKKDLLDMIIMSQPDILNHNVETVPGLYSEVRPMADFKRSIEVIRYFKEKDPDMITKSGMMLGLGETEKEVLEAIEELVSAKCDILTLGQYLQPSSKHIEVKEYVKPEIFDYYKEKAYEAGFKNVASAPLVRSSYHAEDLKF
jgi:lipoic acid synthetase